MSIDNHIRTLLDTEGKVVIPKLGTLEKKYQAASFNKDKKKLSPPATKTYFTPNLKATDDSLEKYIAKVMKIPANESHNLVQQYVDGLRTDLKRNHRAHINSVGLLVIRARQLLFQPEVPDDLPEVPVQKIEKQKEKKPAVPVAATPPLVKKPVIKKEKKPAPAFISYLLFPLILLFITILILLYMLVNPTDIDYFKPKYSGVVPLTFYPADIGPSQSAPDQASSTPTQKETKPAVANEKDIAAVKPVPAPKDDSKKHVITSESQTGSEAAAPLVPTPKTGKYHIIVSSLEYKTMAEVYAKRLVKEGYTNAMIIGPDINGNYRVSVENHQSKIKSLERLIFFRDKITSSAWLLKY